MHAQVHSLSVGRNVWESPRISQTLDWKVGISWQMSSLAFYAGEQLNRLRAGAYALCDRIASNTELFEWLSACRSLPRVSFTVSGTGNDDCPDAGCLEMLESYWNLKSLLEILEISLNLYGPPGNFCVKCRWSSALVSSHDKTGYRIAYLRNWSPFLSLPRPHVVHIMFLFYI